LRSSHRSSNENSVASHDTRLLTDYFPAQDGTEVLS
jgi:hypothetical protein